MHRICLIALLASALLIGCNDDEDSRGIHNTDFFAAETLSVEITRGSRTRFTLGGINGSVRLDASAGASGFSIEAARRVESDSFEDAATHLEQLTVAIDSSDARVLVRTEQPSSSGGRNYIVDYAIALPADITVAVANVNGDVTVDSLDATVTVSVVNGSIDTTVSLPSGGLATLSIVNGSIYLQIPEDTSAGFVANVVNGGISLTGLTLSDVSQTPTSLTGTLGDGNASIVLSAVNGAIVVVGF